MRYPSPYSCDSLDEDDLLPVPAQAMDPAMAGLPVSWRGYRWWIGGLAFSILWVTDSWTSGEHLQGVTFVNHVTQDLWSLLLTFAFSYGVFLVLKHRARRLSSPLCALTAIAVMLARGI